MSKKATFILFAVGLVVLVGYFRWNRTIKVDFQHFNSLDLGEISKEDYQKVLSLHRNCFEELRRHNVTAYLKLNNTEFAALPESEQKERIDGYIWGLRLDQETEFHDTKNVYLAKDGKDIVGLFNCTESPQTIGHGIMVHNLCVKEDLRGKGVGTQLTQKAIEVCAKPTADLFLFIHDDQPELKTFYEKQNFRMVDPQPDFPDEFYYFKKQLMKYSP